jgi:hypothetical protein
MCLVVVQICKNFDCRVDGGAEWSGGGGWAGQVVSLNYHSQEHISLCKASLYIIMA